MRMRKALVGAAAVLLTVVVVLLGAAGGFIQIFTTASRYLKRDQ